MRKEGNYNEAPVESAQANGAAANETSTAGSAFEYLRSLPRNLDRSALDSYKRDRSDIIDSEAAEYFTDNFRGVSDPFFIPVSWYMDKPALVNLLGITGHVGYEEVTGVRFYAGINDDNQLTLIAVSTKAGLDCDDDLTEDDAYPYYDYADPCPDSCSSRGNLKALTPMQTRVAIVTEP